MKKILITGHKGLIGKELLNQLAQTNNYEVIVVDRNTSSVNTIKLDLADNWSDNLLPDKIDVVVHLAQSEKFREFPNAALDIFGINTQSTLKLLNYARKVGAQKFVYASSGGVYGSSENSFVENHPLTANKDLGFYLGTKLCSEILVESYSSIFTTNILRFFFVYGREQKKSMLIPRLVESVKNKNKIILQGDNGIVINPIHVSDAATAIVNVIKLNSSDNYNIAGNENLSLKKIAEIISNYTNVEPVFDIKHNEESRNLLGDNSKMIKYLHNPLVKFEEGLKELV